MEPSRNPRSPAPPPPHPYAAPQPRSAAAGRGPHTPSAPAKSPPCARPPQPTRKTYDGPLPQIELAPPRSPPPPYAAHLPSSTAAGRGHRTADPPPCPHPKRKAYGGSRPQIESAPRRSPPQAAINSATVEPDLRFRAPAAASVAARGASPVPAVAMGPEPRLVVTSAATASGFDTTGSTSGKRVSFTSPLCNHPIRSYCSIAATPTKSCLRSAAVRSPVLQFAAPGSTVTERRQLAGGAHSSARFASQDEDGWSLVLPRRWWRLPEFKSLEH
ncbi:uncharacterized protein [Miscanthus floridulus]|uniref:uncharacterized protein n=1 Tax=Miscanthus floridulus TaxID=154761 RepID=UPI00345A78F3